MKNCEVYDRVLGKMMVRVDIFESLLKEEIAKLESTTVLRLRKSVHAEAKVHHTAPFFSFMADRSFMALCYFDYT